MTNQVLHQALACAERGWPVFPCHPGHKAPLTQHGYLDATTDPAQITAWFARHPDRNLAVATGAPGPDVLDIDIRGPAASGFPALTRLRAAGHLDGAAAQVRTPSGGLHIYFAGSTQRTSHLPACHIDFLSTGGYVITPPSRISGQPYQPVGLLGGRGQLNWAAAAQLLEPSRQRQRHPAPRPAAIPHMDALSQWVAALPEGNRNAGLFWAANRALEASHTDLTPLAVAARQAGLDDPEIDRTLDSARRTTHATPDRQAEEPS